MDEKLFSGLKKLISEKLSVPEDKIRPDSHFINDLEADSLDITELIMELETIHGISIPDEETEKFKTVEDVVEYLEKIQKT